MVYNDLMLFMQFLSILQDLSLVLYVFFIFQLFIPSTILFRFEMYIHIAKKWELDLVSHFKSTIKKEGTFWPWRCDEKTQHGRDFHDGCWGQ